MDSGASFLGSCTSQRFASLGAGPAPGTPKDPKQAVQAPLGPTWQGRLVSIHEQNGYAFGWISLTILCDCDLAQGLSVHQLLLGDKGESSYLFQ